MFTRSDDGNTVQLEYDPFPQRLSGCAAWFLRLASFPLAAGGLLLLFSSIQEMSVTFLSFFGVVLVLFSAVMWLGAGNQKRMNFGITIVLDLDREELRFYKSRPELAYTVPFSHATHVVLRKVHQASSGESTRPSVRYELSLRLQDGARLWLLSRSQSSAFAEAVEELHGLLGLRIVDESGLGLHRDATRTYSEPSESPMPVSPSRFLRVESTERGEVLSLVTREPLAQRAIPFLVCAIFVTIPVMIGVQALVAAFSDPSILAWLFAGVVGIFVMFFISLALLLLLTMLRDYRIHIEETSLQVELRFRMERLQHRLGKKVQIPRAQVRGVRVHVEHGGEFSLALVIDGELSFHEPSRFFRLGVFARHGDGGDEIPLWTIPSAAKEGFGPTFRDIVYLEHLLQQRLSLSSTKA